MIVAIGMDPGPTPGLLWLTYSEQRLLEVSVVQCSANCALNILQMWFETTPSRAEVHFGVERYVDRERGRSGAAGQRTRDMVGSAATLALTHGAHVTENNASRVKAWATDNRLDMAGGASGTSLLTATKGMTHARDAARHALFTAVHDGNIPDPYSRKAKG